MMRQKIGSEQKWDTKVTENKLEARKILEINIRPESKASSRFCYYVPRGSKLTTYFQANNNTKI
jgi:hypothetical protein